jgi:hypothetical protein
MVSAIAISTTTPASAENLAIAATGQTSSFYAYHTAVSQVLGDALEGTNVTVLETGGSVENQKLLERGQADWGQFAEPLFFEKYSGIGASAEQGPSKKLRYLSPVTQVAFFPVVNADSGVQSIGDLNGRGYGPGSSGSNTERLTEDLFATVGVEPEYTRGSYGDLVAAMKDRRIDGYTKAGSLVSEDSTIMDVRSSVPIKILSYTEEQIAKISEAFPHYLFVTVDKTPYGDGPVTLNQVVLINGTTSDLPEETGYKIYKALVENNEKIAETYKPATGVDVVALTLSSAKTPLHAGVVRYLRENGHEVPEGLIPPEAK